MAVALAPRPAHARMPASFGACSLPFGDMESEGVCCVPEAPQLPFGALPVAHCNSKLARLALLTTPQCAYAANVSVRGLRGGPEGANLRARAGSVSQCPAGNARGRAAQSPLPACVQPRAVPDVLARCVLRARGQTGWRGGLPRPRPRPRARSVSPRRDRAW
jgi:hypothetical protein